MGNLQTEDPSSYPTLLIIGAGSRGYAYARAVTESTKSSIAAVAEPQSFQRQDLGRKFIWGEDGAHEGQEFNGWREFLLYEQDRRQRAEKGENVPKGVDGVFVCTLDETHEEIILALAPLNLHIMSEKPLATTLRSCVNIYRSLQAEDAACPSERVFSVGHVLRYSPHNMLLHKLLVQDRVIGDIISIEHTEPVGWWHFSHSYVRGNWRKESTTAPSLLTKSCHDIDLLLWLLCSPSPNNEQPPHLPSLLSSTGSLKYFRQSRKPALAASATNCLSCPAESSCMYSAKKIYNERHLQRGITSWPVKIIIPDIESCFKNDGPAEAEAKLFQRLSEDYDATTPKSVIDSRPWFGRCVYESSNDVCDDQIVTITWDDDPLPADSNLGLNTAAKRLQGRGAKTATFHMVAFTEKICERRGRIYGTAGEIEYDSHTIAVHDFVTEKTVTHRPEQRGGGHGGGDAGLAMQYVDAIQAVKTGRMSAAQAQRAYIGCSVEDVLRSHAVVFAAEEARREGRVVKWGEWWKRNVLEMDDSFEDDDYSLGEEYNAESCFEYEDDEVDMADDYNAERYFDDGDKDDGDRM